MNRDFNKISKKEKQKIIEKITKILSKHKISFAIIFGSFATSNYFRDIDIVVKGSSSKKLIEELEKEIKFEIDLKNWDEISIQMKYFALKEGIRIIFDEDVFSEERRKALNEYFDFQYIINQYNELYLSKI